MVQMSARAGPDFVTVSLFFRSNASAVLKSCGALFRLLTAVLVYQYMFIRIPYITDEVGVQAAKVCSFLLASQYPQQAAT